jgi:hypothetical protein
LNKIAASSRLLPDFQKQSAVEPQPNLPTQSQLKSVPRVSRAEREVISRAFDFFLDLHQNITYCLSEKKVKR